MENSEIKRIGVIGAGSWGTTLANLLAEKGHYVEVFLIDDAIHWAQLGMAEGVRAATGEEMKPFIDYLFKNGCEIVACKA